MSATQNLPLRSSPWDQFDPRPEVVGRGGGRVPWVARGPFELTVSTMVGFVPPGGEDVPGIWSRDEGVVHWISAVSSAATGSESAVGAAGEFVSSWSGFDFGPDSACYNGISTVIFWTIDLDSPEASGVGGLLSLDLRSPRGSQIIRSGGWELKRWKSREITPGVFAYGLRVARGVVLRLSESKVALPDFQNGQALGDVRVIVPAPDGGVWVGGSWDSVTCNVNNVTYDVASGHQNMIHMKSNGEVTAALALHCQGPVNAIEVAEWGWVHVGGAFDSFLESDVSCLAAFNPNLYFSFGHSLTLAEEWTPYIEGVVNAVKIYDGHIYVGGEFSVVDGGPYEENNLCRFVHYNKSLVQTVTRDSGWLPLPNGEVLDILPSGDASDNTVYFAGKFTQINEGVGEMAFTYVRNGAASMYFGYENGQIALGPWDPNVNSNHSPDGAIVKRLAWDKTRERVYLSGNFDEIGSTTVSFIGRVHPVTGVADNWTPEIDFVVNDPMETFVSDMWIDHNNDMIYFAGNFAHYHNSSGNVLYSSIGKAGLSEGNGSLVDRWGPVWTEGTSPALGETTGGGFLYYNPSFERLLVGGKFEASDYLGGDGWRASDGLLLLNNRHKPQIHTPAQPQNLRFTSFNFDQVVVQWDLGETLSWSVYMSIDGGPSEYLVTLPGNITQHQITGLEAERNYVVSVYSIGLGCSVSDPSELSWVSPIEDAEILTLRTWAATDGKVNTVETVASLGTDGIYIGGQFDHVAEPEQITGSCYRYNREGNSNPWGFFTNGVVYDSVVLSDGRVIIVGDFSYAGSTTDPPALNVHRRQNIAMFSASGDLDLTWNPSANSIVFSVAVDETADVVYVGGNFTQLNGTHDRNFIGSIGLVTGQPTTWEPSAGIPTMGLVRDITIFDSPSYPESPVICTVGNSANDNRKVNLFHGSSSKRLNWETDVVGGPVHCVIPYNGGDSLLLGGEFTSLGGQPNLTNLGEVDLTDPVGTANSGLWLHNVDGPVYSILDIDEILSNSIAVGGKFDNVNSTPRGSFAIINYSSGLSTTQIPIEATKDNEREIRSLSFIEDDGKRLLLGGRFIGVGGEARYNVAEFDLSTSVTTSLNPGTSGIVYSVNYSGGNIIVGGRFSFATSYSHQRGGLAKLSLNGNIDSNLQLGLEINSGDEICAIHRSGTDIIIGGDFTQFGGLSRGCIASFNVSDGVLTTWNPDINGKVNSIKSGADQIFVGGDYTVAGVTNRTNLCSFKLNAPSPTTWNPSPNNIIRVISILGDKIYVGGDFTQFGGFNNIKGIARFDVGENIPDLLWDPDIDGNPNYGPDPSIWGITQRPDEKLVVLVGEFETAGVNNRVNVAEIDTVSKEATTLIVEAISGPVKSSIFLDDKHVFGGVFEAVKDGSISRSNLVTITKENILCSEPHEGVRSYGVGGIDIQSIARLDDKTYPLVGMSYIVGGKFDLISSDPKSSLFFPGQNLLLGRVEESTEIQ